MKKILSLLVTFVMLIGFLPNSTFSDNNTGYYVVTAYYSPLPNQKHYLTGNYESEKRLNGQGIAGASGKPVFSGMLAGPQTYSFGTKIYIEGLGIGEIADRGGAIVSAGNRGYKYDRLDIWVGYGDEGLQRALYWGKRTVKGNIVSHKSAVTIDFTKMYAPEWATTGLQKQNKIFDISLGIGSNPDRVKELQKFFSELGIYNGEIDGIYNSEMVSIVYNFQLNNGIVSSTIDSGSGYWGVKTRTSFKKAYLNGEFDEIPVANFQEQSDSNFQEQPHPSPLLIGKVIEGNNLNIFDNAISGIENTKKLQEILIEMGLYDGEITGNYDDITGVIYDYQVSNEIVLNKSTPGAGNFGPKTRVSLKETYNSYLDELAKKEELRLEEEKRKKELEEKYKQLEKYALEQATKRTSNLPLLKEGDVSQNVRELQLILKDLGYFNENDTAIFGKKTKEAVIVFQLDYDLIDKTDSKFAGIVGERMISYLNTELSNLYLKEQLKKSDLDLEELASVINIELVF